MLCFRAVAVLGCLIVACGSTAAPKPLSPSVEPPKPERASPASSKSAEPSQVSQWSEVPQNEPASQSTVIGRRNARVIVVSEPSSHGDALHFQFVVNSVAISGVFSAPGGRNSTFTLPAGSVQFTVDECKGDPQYFELPPSTQVELKCEMTTEGDCCYPADGEEQH